MGLDFLKGLIGAGTGYATGGPVGAVIGGFSGLMSGSDGSNSHASQTTAMTPAPWEADAKQLWDEFLNRWYGSPSGGSGSSGTGTTSSGGTTDSGSTTSSEYAYDINNPAASPQPLQPDHVYIRNLNVDSPWYGKIMDMGPNYTTKQTVEYVPIGRGGEYQVVEKQVYNPYLTARGNFERLGTGADLGATSSGQSGATSDNTDSLLNMLRQDEAERKAAEEAFVNTEQGITNRSTGNINRITNQYNQATQPIALKIGNFTTNWTPGNILRAANQNYRNNISSVGLLQALAEAQAERQKNLGQTYTTNAADINYLTNLLEPLAMQLQGFRYHIPTSTQSATLPGDDTLTQIAKGLGLGKTAWDWYKSFTAPSFNSTMPSNYNPASIAPTTALDSMLGIYD